MLLSQLYLDLAVLVVPAAAAAMAHRALPALLVTAAFALLAWKLHAVDTSGAIAGLVVTFLLFVSAGWGAFAAVATVFVLAFLTTRLGYRHKQFLGTAERQGGRNAAQVLANLGVATACAIVFVLAGRPEIWLLGLSAALAEAAADTVSSEYGQASTDSAYLITTWELVPAGTDGGISLAGTLAGIAGALLVALVCAATGLLHRRWIAATVAAAVLGMLADSYLGAWWERRRRLSNDQVNFLSTVTAAALAIVFARFL